MTNDFLVGILIGASALFTAAMIALNAIHHFS
jgi:hypothetical protein